MDNKMAINKKNKLKIKKSQTLSINVFHFFVKKLT